MDNDPNTHHEDIIKEIIDGYEILEIIYVHQMKDGFSFCKKQYLNGTCVPCNNKNIPDEMKFEEFLGVAIPYHDKLKKIIRKDKHAPGSYKDEIIGLERLISRIGEDKFEKIKEKYNKNH